MAISKKLQEAVEEYTSALLNAEVIRERVNELSKGVLSRSIFAHESGRQRIIDPQDAWLMSEKSLSNYLTELRGDLERSGLKVKSEPGQPRHCFRDPASVAEDEVAVKKYAMVRQALKDTGQDPDEYFARRISLAKIEDYDKFATGVAGVVQKHQRFDFENALSRDFTRAAMPRQKQSLRAVAMAR